VAIMLNLDESWQVNQFGEWNGRDWGTEWQREAGQAGGPFTSLYNAREAVDIDRLMDELGEE
jgi:hypothetical protein